MGYGKQIRKKRRELDISQAQMAEALGVTQAWVSYVESETFNPSEEMMEKITEFFLTYKDTLKE